MSTCHTLVVSTCVEQRFVIGVAFEQLAQKRTQWHSVITMGSTWEAQIYTKESKRTQRLVSCFLHFVLWSSKLARVSSNCQSCKGARRYEKQVLVRFFVGYDRGEINERIVERNLKVLLDLLRKKMRKWSRTASKRFRPIVTHKPGIETNSRICCALAPRKWNG